MVILAPEINTFLTFFKYCSLGVCKIIPDDRQYWVFKRNSHYDKNDGVNGVNSHGVNGVNSYYAESGINGLKINTSEVFKSVY